MFFHQNQILQNQYETALAQCSPILEMEKRYKTMLEVQSRYDTMIKQYSPMLEVQKQYNTMLEQYKPMLDVQEQYKSMLDTDTYVFDMQKLVQEQMSPIIEAQKLIYNQIKPMLETYKDIDWASMSRAAAEELKGIDRKLIENEEEYWCLDIDIMADILNGEVTQDTLSECIENRLDEYIEKITQNPMYEIHISLIQEAYEAYKIGLYKLCIMPLFAAFEHVIAFWFKGHITKEMVSIKSNPDVPRLYKKIDP
ncbi:hypothetical protein [Bacillus cereus]|uniref:Uncharacterized protein n=1 Tax=Bacillus cereus TaxID=1396 RepID=A0A2A7HR26_BACCE|nr:hypothetical protein [Bacillus cereus]PEC19303.1 hypothetical protein COM96_25775 [Bacillus cereus]